MTKLGPQVFSSRVRYRPPARWHAWLNHHRGAQAGDAPWVRRVRAAGGHAVLRRRSTRAVRWRNWTSRIATVADVEDIASYPVFRVHPGRG